MSLVPGRVVVCGITGASDAKASKQSVVPSISDNGSPYRSGRSIAKLSISSTGLPPQRPPNGQIDSYECRRC